MRSKLYQAVVLLGISGGVAASGCLGESRPGDGAPEDSDGLAGKGQGSTGGRGAAGGTGGAGSSGGTTGAGASSAGTSAVAGTGGDATGGASSGGGEAGASGPATGGSGNQAAGGSAGAGATGGIVDAGMDTPTDAFCDETWPTTKGNPAKPPTCEDQAACGGPANDASFQRWLQCRPRLGDMQCEYSHVTSICVNGEWECPPDGMPDGDCRCMGPRPEGWVCTEDGWLLVDAGVAGAPG